MKNYLQSARLRQPTCWLDGRSWGHGRIGIVLLLLLCVCSLCFAQTASGNFLVERIYPADSNALGRNYHFESDAFRLIVTFFGDSDCELAVTDGTSEGTHPIKRLSVVSNLFEFKNGALFRGGDSEHGGELWFTDGTAAGTRMISDILPGKSSSNPSGFFRLGDKALFVARTDDYGLEPWITDGTAQGTRLLKDVREGEDDSCVRGTFYAMEFSSKLIMSLDDGVHGNEWWITDGTEAGTKLLKDRLPGPDGGGKETLACKQSGGKLFFFSRNPGSYKSCELWETDGTSEGTQLVYSFPDYANHDDIIGVNVQYPIERQGLLYFILYYEYYNESDEGGICHLWSTDGTTTGTTHLLEFNMMSLNCPVDLKLINDQFYFFTYRLFSHNELHRWDPVSHTQQLVSENCRGESVEVNGTMYFKYFVDGHGWELGRSDGTPEGTCMVKDIWPGTQSGGVDGLKVFGDGMVFFANDGVNGKQVWYSDGTERGTKMITSSATAELGVANVTSMTPSMGLLFLIVNKGCWVVRPVGNAVGEEWPLYASVSSQRAPFLTGLQRLLQIRPLDSF